MKYYPNLYGGEIYLKGAVYLIGEKATLRLLVMSHRFNRSRSIPREYTLGYSFAHRESIAIIFGAGG